MVKTKSEFMFQLICDGGIVGYMWLINDAERYRRTLDPSEVLEMGPVLHDHKCLGMKAKGQWWFEGDTFSHNNRDGVIFYKDGCFQVKITGEQKWYPTYITGYLFDDKFKKTGSVYDET